MQRAPTDFFCVPELERYLQLLGSTMHPTMVIFCLRLGYDATW